VNWIDDVPDCFLRVPRVCEPCTHIGITARSQSQLLPATHRASLSTRLAVIVRAISERLRYFNQSRETTDSKVGWQRKLVRLESLIEYLS
jgi:hypothetical protein